MDDSFFNRWVDLEAKRQRRRGYPHFDARVNVTVQRDEIRDLLGSPDRIDAHRFLPFIAYTVETPRYKKTGKVDSTGKEIREKVVKPRPIAYACHWDSLIYSWYAEDLTARYERLLRDRGIHQCVSAYLRRGTSNIESAHEAFEFIRAKGECTALAFDLTSFYDTLDHFRLKRNWMEVLDEQTLPDAHHAVFKSITRYHTVQRAVLTKLFPKYKKSVTKKLFVPVICSRREFTELVVNAGHVEENAFVNRNCGSRRFGKRCGVPQGSPISACLSNLYMLHFDEAMQSLALSIGGMYRRYSDDILFICPTSEAGLVKEGVLAEVLHHELILNKDKTEELVFSRERSGRLISSRVIEGVRGKPKSLQYLGFEFDGSRIYIRSSSFSRYQARLRARIKKGLAAASGDKSLSPVMFRRKLFNRSTDKGKRNFITYAQRAAKVMSSREIMRQTKNNNKKVKELLEGMEREIDERRSELRGRQVVTIS
ncbi:MAG: hypothetical protein KA941_07735 [Flavobacteriales bacterium]|nr:hypothetical protein [Flavobacteriales bacterium]